MCIYVCVCVCVGNHGQPLRYKDPYPKTSRKTRRNGRRRHEVLEPVPDNEGPGLGGEGAMTQRSLESVKEPLIYDPFLVVELRVGGV